MFPGAIQKGCACVEFQLLLPLVASMYKWFSLTAILNC